MTPTRILLYIKHNGLFVISGIFRIKASLVRESGTVQNERMARANVVTDE